MTAIIDTPQRDRMIERAAEAIVNGGYCSLSDSETEVMRRDKDFKDKVKTRVRQIKTGRW